MDAPVCGVVNLYKEAGYTSQDAIHVLQGILHADKIGHTGTLDPEATGVLPVCIGKATKAAEIITGTDKEYRAQLRFGAETDTQDATGKVLKTFIYTFDEALVRQVCASFVGEILQTPPMYSALKHNGQKLYQLARAGMEVERKPRSIIIHALDILDLNESGMTILVRCSKGTYIRTLCEDIGKKLGYGAYMSALERTGCGPYRVEESFTLKQIEVMMQEDRRDEFLVDLGTLFAHLPAWQVIPEEDILLLSGNYLTYPSDCIDGREGDAVRMLLSDGRLAALYRISEHPILEGVPHTRLRAYKMFV
ncbi:MAG: tRNA pseudouridine(55) synthase TruB [Lachnospiraceae bacterium]|nr:tRNA pseudouridine(55) synthase TruB [Lachnospiraceae bacterium]